jgi:transposase
MFHWCPRRIPPTDDLLSSARGREGGALFGFYGCHRKRTGLASRADPIALRLLRTHPGVGLLTSLAVVHTLEPVTRFDRARRVAAYCGLDPLEDSSGDSERIGHISKQGNRLLRHLLLEAARSAVRGKADADLRSFYFRLIGRKNNSAVAMTAVARKLVPRLYRVLHENVDSTESAKVVTCLQIRESCHA